MEIPKPRRLKLDVHAAWFFVLVVFLVSVNSAESRDIILVHDKGLPRHYVNRTYRDLREYQRDRNSFFYVIDLDSGKILRRYQTRYGQYRSPKLHGGDRRTPVGKYEIVRIRPKPCNSVFGPYSVLISYPNYFDRKRHNPGSAITIHGGPDRMTLGCIRILDYGHYYISYTCPGSISNHVKAIYELCNRFCYGSGSLPPVLSFSSLNRRYKGREGHILGSYAIRFYRKALEMSIDNFKLDRIAAGAESFPTQRKPSIKGVLTACASSCLGNFQNITYDPNNVLDGKPYTAWVEGDKWGSGIGEWIMILLHETRKIASISIMNGYIKQVGAQDRWLQNNRVKRCVIELYDGDRSYTVGCNLADVKGWQTITFRRPVPTRYVKLIIKEVYHGTRWDDTCISEIKIR